MINFFKVALIKMVAILLMSAKFATLGLPKRHVFWNKGCGVLISVHDVTNKIFTPWFKLNCRCCPKSIAKWSKLKVRKCLGLVLTFIQVTVESCYAQFLLIDRIVMNFLAATYALKSKWQLEINWKLLKHWWTVVKLKLEHKNLIDLLIY